MCFNEDHQAFNALHAALIADALGKSADRDRLLAKIVAPNPAPSSRGPAYAAMYRELVQLLQKALPPGSVKDLDFKKIEALISKDLNVEVPTNFEYFIGMFLKNRGDKEKSREYLIRREVGPDQQVQQCVRTANAAQISRFPCLRKRWFRVPRGKSDRQTLRPLPLIRQFSLRTKSVLACHGSPAHRF